MRKVAAIIASESGHRSLDWAMTKSTTLKVWSSVILGTWLVHEVVYFAVYLRH